MGIKLRYSNNVLKGIGYHTKNPRVMITDSPSHTQLRQPYDIFQSKNHKEN